MADPNPTRFEDEMADLERQSISAFERGVALVRSLNQKLDEIERRVEVLIRDSHGELKRSPYQGELAPNNKSEENEEDDNF